MTHNRYRLLFLVSILIGNHPAQAEEQKPIIAVFSLEAKRVTLAKDALFALDEFLAAALAETGQFKILPRDQIKTRLTEQKKASYRECYEQSCQIEIGRELAANKSLATQVVKIGKKCMVSSTIFDLKQATAEIAGKAEGDCTEEGIKGALEAVVHKLALANTPSNSGISEKPNLPIIPPPSPPLVSNNTPSVKPRVLTGRLKIIGQPRGTRVAIKERAPANWNTLCSLPCDLKELQFGWYLVEAQLAGHKPFPFQQWVEVKQQTPTVVIKLIPIPSSITNPQDQSPMVLVGEGAFAMGSPWGEGDNDEHPQHNVYLPAYYVDKYEISMGQYRQCVQEGGCSPPDAGGRCTWGNAGKERYPINCVSWAQSAAYCRWAGKRLPSEAEWEKAARGPDGRRYPWGNQEPTCQLAQFRSCGDRLVSVDSYGGVPSPYGAVQLAGNVWEWVADWHGETYYAEAPPSNPQGPASGIFHVLRGGSWVANPPLLRSADRYYTPTTHDQGVGFRCAKHP